MQTNHQDFAPARTTGARPAAAMGEIADGREDMVGDPSWQGCLDAPEQLLAGGVEAIFAPGGYVGTTPATLLR